MPRDEPLRLLFVCTANVCRSPLAESFMTKRCKNAGGLALTASASIDDEIRSIHPLVTTILGEHGITRKRDSSQPLSQEFVRAADLVLTMTGAHAITVASRYPADLVKVFMLDHVLKVIRPKTPEESLADWLTHLRSQPRSYPNQAGAHDIVDPVNEDEQTFRSVAEHIDGLTDQLVRALAPTAG